MIHKLRIAASIALAIVVVASVIKDIWIWSRDVIAIVKETGDD